MTVVYCPGLNSVIYGIMLKAYDTGIECVGILKGWKGLMENLTIPLKIAEHDDLHTIGGTILYTSRTNPFKGVESKEEVAQDLVAKLDELGIDALIAIGGDAYEMNKILDPKPALYPFVQTIYFYVAIPLFGTVVDFMISIWYLVNGVPYDPKILFSLIIAGIIPGILEGL